MVEPDFRVYCVAPFLAVPGYLLQGGLGERSAHARFFYRGGERRGGERRGGHCHLVGLACASIALGCGLHANRIRVASAFLPTLSCSRSCRLNTRWTVRGPGIVLGPVMYDVGRLTALQETKLRDHGDEGTRFPSPVRCDLKIFRRQPRKVAVRPIVRDPGEETEESPGAAVPEPPAKLHRFRVPRECRGNSEIVSH